MDDFKLALLLETDADGTVVAIDHVDCTVSPTVHFLGLDLGQVLVDARESGGTKLGGTIPCRYTVEQSSEGAVTRVHTPCCPAPAVPKQGRAANIERLGELMQASDRQQFACCSLRPLRLNSAEDSDPPELNGPVLIQETLLTMAGDSAALVAQIGSDVIFALPDSSAEEIEWLVSRTNEHIAKVLSYSIDLRSGVSEIRFNDGPYLAIQRAEDAMVAALERNAGSQPHGLA